MLSSVSINTESGANCCGLQVWTSSFSPDVILHESYAFLPPPTTTQYDLSSCNAKMDCSSQDAATWNAKHQHTKQMAVQVLREIRPLTGSLDDLFLNIRFIKKKKERRSAMSTLKWKHKQQTGEK